MKKLLIRIFAIFIFAMLASHAADAPPLPPSTEQILRLQKALVTKISEGQIQVIRTFKVTDELQGFVAKTHQGKEVILYVNQKADLVFMGNLINQEGIDLTARFNQDYILAEISQQAFTAVQKTTWFVEGQDIAPHKFYVVMDPSCGYCRKQYALLQPLIAAGKIQVRWVMVGYLKPESAGISAAVLLGKNDAQKIERLAQQEKSDNITPLHSDANDLLTNSVFAIVSKNTAFFEKYSTYFSGVPTILYLNEQHQAQFYPGMISVEHMDSFLSHVSSAWSE